MPERIVAGEEVAFTDQSKAAEGCEIVKREWTFGAILSTEENPKITFGSHGKINVSLTVTDNKKRKDTKTVTMDIAKGAGSLGVLWSHSYDEQGVVYGTSPATSADGEWKNPVTVASGTFGSGAEYSEFVDLNRLGAVTTKGVANKPWEGNPTPRVADRKSVV